jgi:hypothetical protein
MFDLEGRYRVAQVERELAEQRLRRRGALTIPASRPARRRWPVTVTVTIAFGWPGRDAPVSDLKLPCRQ